MVAVTDRDQIGYGDWINYIVTSSSLFTVDNQTGKVYATSPLTLPPSIASMVLTASLSAVDSHGARDNNSQLVVTVTDVNNHRPEFSDAVYYGSINREWISTR